MEIGIGLAVLVAVATNLASLLKHRGCQDTASVSGSQKLAGLRDLAGSRWFAAGWALAAVAWLAHAAALSLAPISLVQGILAGGAVTLAVLSQRFFGQPVGRRQWAALAIGAVGLVLLAAAIALGHRSERLTTRHGVLRAVLAGLLFALAGIAIKAVLGGSGSVALTASLVLVVIACGALAQYPAVASLQSGGAIETIGLMGLVANATQIVGGILVFGDPLSPSPLGIALQILAFAMVCLSALLLPGPVVQRVVPRLAPRV